MGISDKKDSLLKESGQNVHNALKIKLPPKGPDGIYTLAVSGVDRSVITKTFTIKSTIKNNSPVNTILPKKSNQQSNKNQDEVCSDSYISDRIRSYELNNAEAKLFTEKCFALRRHEIEYLDLEAIEVSVKLDAKKRVERQNMDPIHRQEAETQDKILATVVGMGMKKTFEEIGDFHEQFTGNRGALENGDGLSANNPYKNKEFIYAPALGKGDQSWYAWRGKLLTCESGTCYLLAEKKVLGDYGKKYNQLEIFAAELGLAAQQKLQQGKIYIIKGQYQESIKVKAGQVCAKLSNCSIAEDFNIFDYQ